jgi:hypothetical protein
MPDCPGSRTRLRLSMLMVEKYATANAFESGSDGSPAIKLLASLPMTVAVLCCLNAPAAPQGCGTCAACQAIQESRTNGVPVTREDRIQYEVHSRFGAYTVHIRLPVARHT